ncbi:MAG: GWxTD domain-containing protein [Ignavibacteria bacterium]|jgi:GWxTD domain-containing protein
MKKLIIFSLICLLTNFSANYAQELLAFEFDYARFKYDSNSVFLEIYYSFAQNDLTIEKTNEGYLVKGIIHIELKDSATGEYYVMKDWKVQNILPDTAGIINTDLVGLVSIVVPEGIYELVVEGRDFSHAERKKRITDRLEINAFPADQYVISDIQLSSNIIKDSSNKESIFYKNTFEVIPNPSMVYSENSPVLFYYSELYNLQKTSSNSALRLDKLLYNNRGSLIYKNTKMISGKQKSSVECGVLNLKKYPTGSYNFMLALVDTTTQKAYLSNKKFYLYNEGVVDESETIVAQGGYMSSEFGVYTKDECDQMFDYVKYIATEAEKDQYEKLGMIEAKREFLYNFWARRDTRLETPRNEFKEEYMQRVEYANRNFGHQFKDGYKSDRGRVYLLYGEPDLLDRYPSEKELKPYEKWFYNSIEGGVEFIFGDVTGFSNYELLHSTKRGELSDGNWIRRIQE